MKASQFLPTLASGCKSLAKVAILSRRTAPIPHVGGESVVVLGNGPSLNDTISRYEPLLASTPTIAVNFMANSPVFHRLKPKYYVLADPLFFSGTEHENVSSLWNMLSKVDYDMALCVPRQRVKTARKLLGASCHKVKVFGFNFVGASGFAWLEKALYSRALAMPRPRNVLVPAIMTAIRAGYKDIYVAGADHSWLETLRVNDDNHVISIQPHFYADSKKELARSEKEYRNIRLHELLDSFRIAFASYHTLRRFADAVGVNIYNSTPRSYIDAFERRDISSILS